MNFNNLICTHIETIAFDDQRVTFANSDMEVVLKIKNQALHNKFSKGDKLVKETKKAKAKEAKGDKKK